MSKIFVNYRRDDVKADARGIYQALAAKFGAGRVFMDVRGLSGGQEFDKIIADELAKSDVLVAVIGPNWLPLLKARQASGAKDLMRDEIATALQRGAIVIPVLIDRASPPQPEELPEDIRRLVARETEEVRHKYFDQDMAAVVRVIERRRREVPRTSSRSNQIARWAGISACVSAIAAVGWVLLNQLQSLPIPPPAKAALQMPNQPIIAGNIIRLGIALPITGADAGDAILIQHGFETAIAEANAAGGIGGIKLEAVLKDSGTVTAGQYDPAQAASNTRALVADPSVLAVLGPEMSGEGKAMAPILSEADLATITPSSTNPDLTDPALASQYMPKGRPIYFRTLTTDAFQGPLMANFYKKVLKVSNVYVLDDQGRYGVMIADQFQARAEKIGLKVLGRDRLDPNKPDYTSVLVKIKQLNADSIYYGGVDLAGIKLAKQLAEILPNVKKGGGDGIYSQDFLTGVGFPAVEGWYFTSVGPHFVGEPAASSFSGTFQKTYNATPNDYSLLAYDAAQVAIDAIRRVAAAGKELSRSNVRDAIQESKLRTLQGEVSFDKYGDINDRAVSIF